MKAIIEFDLGLESDDQYEWETFIDMNKTRRALEEGLDTIRTKLKYSQISDDTKQALEEVRDVIYEHLNS